jgi:hypothetical protein
MIRDKMKINFIIFCLLFTNRNWAIAQQSETAPSPKLKSSIGIFGGLNFQNINGKDANGDALTNSLVTRYHFGLNGAIPISPEFNFQIGLQFISKGTKGDVIYNNSTGDHTIKREIKMNYLEVPLHLVYKPLLGQGHLILGFGPYVGYSIGGKVKFTGNPIPPDSDVIFIKDVPDSEKNILTYFRHTDIGSDFFVGYELNNGLNFVLNSQLGLININSGTSSKLSNKNTGFGLSVGYRF